MIIYLFIYFGLLILLSIMTLIFASRFHIKRPIRFIAALSILFMLPLIFGYLFLAYVDPLPETIVPDVVGLSEKDAIGRLEELDLKSKIESRDHGSNLITSQRPEPGKIVKVGRVVVINIGKQGNSAIFPESVVISPLSTPETNSTSEIKIEILNGGRSQ